MKWEYLTIRIDLISPSPTKFIEKFNQLGEDGWELVSEHSRGFFTFKRPKQ